jgi:3-deoxy-7-phosphoheptulonate synthase
MKTDASDRDVERVCEIVREKGLTPHPIAGQLRTVVAVTGNLGPVAPNQLSLMPGVAEVVRVTRPYKLAGRETKAEDTIVLVSGVRFGEEDVVVIAGPCSVESYEQMIETARAAKNLGANVLRGGAYKPRTSPYSFQGLGIEGLRILREVREETNLPVVSEAVDTECFSLVEDVADIVQIGARNMQNFSLLRRAGRSNRPILLKRGFAATVNEFLLAAEYILSEGNPNVILCERGVRSFSDFTRFTLDISIVPELKHRTHLPVLVDPSHAAGRCELVAALARAAVAAGADGVMVEIHPDPPRALSDGRQALTPAMLEELIEDIRIIAPAARRNANATR